MEAGLNEILGGKYRVVRLIGRGGMSAVYEAEDLRLGKSWAVKIIDSSRPEYRELLRKDGTLAEIEILGALDHPLAPRLVDSFEKDGLIFLVMDLIEGESLQQRLNRMGRADPAPAVSWMEDVLSLLSYLHDNGIIYRDLKPQNLMLDASGRARLVDFGFPTKIVKEGDYSDERSFGTRGYAAPEQARGYSDERSDVYAAGVTLYQLLTGADPAAKRFKLRPLSRVLPGVSPGLAAVIAKAVKSDPKERFSSAAAMLDALRNYEKAEKPYIDRLRRKISISRGLLAVSLALMLAGGLAAEIFYLKDLGEYDSLIQKNAVISGSSEEELLAAIGIMPYKAEAYGLLADRSREKGLSEEELKTLERLYENYERYALVKGEDCCLLNFRIAQAWIASAETPFDDCLARVCRVLPFLKRAGAGRSLGSLAAAFASLAEASESGAGRELIDAAARSCPAAARGRSGFIGQGATEAKLASQKAVLEFVILRAEEIKAYGLGEYVRPALDLIGEELKALPRTADEEKAAAVSAALKEARRLSGL